MSSLVSGDGVLGTGSMFLRAEKLFGGEYLKKSISSTLIVRVGFRRVSTTRVRF